LVASCGGHGLAIDYRSVASVPRPPPTASVALQVRNARSPEHGGLTERVGTLYATTRGLSPASPAHYSGRPLNAEDPETVTDTVRSATFDALVHAGVSISPGGPLLIASVRDYWADGHDLKKGVIYVSYDLTSPDGRILWHTDVRGEASVVLMVGNSLVRLFREALSDVAQHAYDAFRAPDFQAALRSH
jgi:hypothetical protein